MGEPLPFSFPESNIFGTRGQTPWNNRYYLREWVTGPLCNRTALLLPTSFNPSDAEAWMYYEIKVNLTADNALVPYVSRPSVCYWLSKINGPLSSMMKCFNYLCHFSIGEWYKMRIHIHASWHKFQTQKGVTRSHRHMHHPNTISPHWFINHHFSFNPKLNKSTHYEE